MQSLMFERDVIYQAHVLQVSESLCLYSLIIRVILFFTDLFNAAVSRSVDWCQMIR